ncbi:MAG: Lrp/AsnC ligand binding domain-containing protein [Candidatus Ancaeobacter aquaticus]|nr:Lrp/AsnC ligand binding domain-containing protein [Candidatus Ancaeobacter aquaticus]
MAKAYLKIIVEGGKESKIKTALLKIKGVKSAELTTGEQDIICLIEGKTHKDVLRLIIDKIRKIKGVKETVTNLILE